MGKKPKARSPARKAGKAKVEDPAQSERFIETARDLGVEEDPDQFERAFSKIVPPKPKQSSPP
jgi:hypothetical protein